MKELWIRSQDRLRLVKTTDICIDYNNQKSLIANCRNLSNGNDDYFPLGEYDTEERALEVLDEIQNILKPQMILSKVGKPIAETCDGLVYREPDEYEIKEVSTYVYEMPKE